MLSHCGEMPITASSRAFGDDFSASLTEYDIVVVRISSIASIVVHKY